MRSKPVEKFKNFSAPLNWSVAYIALMAVGLVVTVAFSGKGYLAVEFPVLFLPAAAILTGYSFYALRRSGGSLGKINVQALIWALPWVMLEMGLIGAVILRGEAFSRYTMALQLGFLATAILIGFAEEIMFRGVLFNGLLKGQVKPIYAVLVSAVMFSLLHVVNILAFLPPAQLVQQLISTFIFGLATALMVAVARSLWPAIIVHAGWDFALLFSGESSFWDQYGGLVIVIGFAMQIVLCVLAAWFWQRRNKLACAATQDS